MKKQTTTNLKTKSYIVIFFWLLIVGSAFGINYSNVTRAQNDLAFQTARAFFDQIVVSRTWNSGHGGVYVPITENTQPNPYLDDPLRDLETFKRLKLTKINPAFMTRQIAEIAVREKGVQFHITSLLPIRPGNETPRSKLRGISTKDISDNNAASSGVFTLRENKPSDWERVWLESFDKGNKEQTD